MSTSTPGPTGSGEPIELDEIGYLSAPLSAVERGSNTVHAAPLLQHPWGKYPRLTSVCGVRGWGEAGGPVTCKRCLRALAASTDQTEERAS